LFNQPSTGINAMLSQSAIREDVTNRVVAALQSGAVPFWRQTWAKSENSGSPTSAVSGKPYRGINRILLSLLGHESKWFATYAGWRSLGGQVRRAERGVTAIIYKPVTKKKVNDDGEEEQSSFAFMKTFSLFHISQVDVDLSRFRDTPKPNSEPKFVDYGPAEEVFAATGADVRFGGDRAFYSPSHDFIQLPQKNAFSVGKEHEFYSVLAHETVHWSGHESRLNRLKKFARFGSEAYAIEELTADLGAAFLCNEIAIPQSDDLSNISAYLNHWVKVLQRDHTAIFSVASSSSAAVDSILAYSRPKAESDVEAEADAVMA
jgi:antirestriction protein ArdC